VADTFLVTTKECPMKRLLTAVVLAGAAGLALAYGCPEDMKAIDAKLATNPQLSAADATKVKQLRADGEAAHKAGKHDDSMKALGNARPAVPSRAERLSASSIADHPWWSGRGVRRLETAPTSDSPASGPGCDRVR
jgi:hypothetical protein